MKKVYEKDIFKFLEPMIKTWAPSVTADIWISRRSDGGINIEISGMYECPFNPTFANLKKISEFFSTDDMNVNDYNVEGCETCDFGSKYTNTVNVLNPGVTVLLYGEEEPKQSLVSKF